MNPAFHVSLLKMGKRTPDSQYMPLPLTTTVHGSRFQPLVILDNCRIQICYMWVPEILIQWEGIGEYT